MCANPVLEYAVAVLPVLATRVVQVVPPSADLSILYPVMAEPPLSVGAVQVRLTCEEDAAVAVTPVGGDGVAMGVVADAVMEGGLVPTELMAETL